MADYAISNVPRRVVYAASGTGPYAFTFEILAAGDIAVYKGDTLLTLTTDYSVTINANGTGSVTLVATAGTSNITIVGSKTIARTTDFTTGGDFFANTLNDELDAQTIFIQQVAETAERGLKAPVTDPTDINMTLPRKADRAGKYLAFDADGNPQPGDTAVEVAAIASIADEILVVAGISDEVVAVAGNETNIDTVAGSISNVNSVGSNIANVNATATNITNVNAVGSDLLEAESEINTVATSIADVNTVGTNIASVTAVAANETNIDAVAANETNIDTVAGISSNVSTVAGISANVTTVAGISANVTSVAGNSTNINAVAGNATNINAVASNATNINAVAANETNIDAVAADATDIGTVASGIANVNTVASNISNVNTVAGISADVSTVATNVADVTNYADTYLGAKTSDPATRNDSSALQAGDLYFNTTDDVMKVYEGASWVAAYASLSGALIAANNLSDLTSASTARTNLELGSLSTISPTGTASSSTYLRGDNTWSEINVTPALDNLSDVTITTPATDQVLKYDGAGWVNGAAPAGGQYFGTAAVKAIAYNADTISEDITMDYSGQSVGPITVSSGYAVTVNSGKRWVVL